MSEGEFDRSATKYQKYGVEPLRSLLVGTASNSQPQLLDGAIFRIWMMTRATDARSKVLFKIVQAKNSVFTNGLLANGLNRFFLFTSQSPIQAPN
jgi:hypothetical protein